MTPIAKPSRYQQWRAERELRKTISRDEFLLDDSLLGLKLASPSRRALAILFDGLCILFFSSMGMATTFVVCFLLLLPRFIRELREHDWLRAGREALIMLTLLVLVGQFDNLAERAKHSSGTGDIVLDNPIDAIPTVGTMLVAVKALEQSESPEQKQIIVNKMRDTLIEAGIEREKVEATLMETVKELTEPQEAIELVTMSMNDTDQTVIINAARPIVEGKVETNQSVADQTATASSTETVVAPVSEDIKAEKDEQDRSDTSSSFLHSLLDDLGLTFGWAAFYFTVFTRHWQGQTPGKRLMGIRVVQLDASDISYWESFSRYGGYAAGFATGMLGFMQIFWDRNRQSTHDKISGTFVVKV